MRQNPHVLSPETFRYFSNTIRSSVSVPVLSVHRTSISPNVWIAPRVRTITFLRDIDTAPLASVEVMITGSISGVSPTAMLIANRKAVDQSFFATPLMTNTIGP